MRTLTDGKGADLVLDAVGGPMFEACLKSLRRGGRQIAITSGKDRRVSFDLIDFYHNELHLMGVDTMKFSGKEIAEILGITQTNVSTKIGRLKQKIRAEV